MKDIDGVHYFGDWEVLHCPSEVFVGQGKYAMDIMKRFDMMDYKLLATTIIPNMNLLANSDYPSVYRQLRGSLMSLVKKRLPLFFSENIESVYG